MSADNNGIAVQDPLMFKEPEEEGEPPMEDLTKHLENSQLIEERQYPGPVETRPAASASQNPLASPVDSPISPEAFASYGQLVNPPSYEDSMMFDAAQASTSSATAPVLSHLESLPIQSQSEEAMQISVSEPLKKEQQGVFGLKGGYVVYKVTTKTTLNHFRAKEFSVRRRFREVVELASILKERFRGYFVPPRPDKNAVEGQRMKEAFVEERRTALQKYLGHLARHPVISRSEELRLFLEVEGELAHCGAWAALLPSGGGLIEGTAKLGRQLTGREALVLDPEEASKPNKKAGNIVRAVKESVQGLRSAPSTDAEEAALRKQRDNLEALREALLLTSRAAEVFVEKSDKVAAVLGDLSFALGGLGKFEESNGGPMAKYSGTIRQCNLVVADCKRSSTALMKLSKLTRVAAGRSAGVLEPLHEYLAFMPNALRAFGSREHQLLTQQTVEADLEVRRRSILELEGSGQRVLGGDRSKTRRVQDLKDEVARLEAASVAAKQEYDKIKTANTTELERFQLEERADFTRMLQELATLQVSAAELNTNTWLQLAKDLGASPEELAAVAGHDGTSASLSATPAV